MADAATAVGGNVPPESVFADTDTPSSAGTTILNTEAHDDPVDRPEDVSWAWAPGSTTEQSMLRVLMTDAPVDADSVLVTFCGVYVEPGADGGAAPASAPAAEEAEAADAVDPADPSS